MKLPRVRLTIGALMMAVVLAALAVLACIPTIRRRSLIFRHRAAYHAKLVELATVTRVVKQDGTLADAAELAEFQRQLVRYHAAKRREFERSTWLPAAPAGHWDSDPIPGSMMLSVGQMDMNFKPGIKAADSRDYAPASE